MVRPDEYDVYWGDFHKHATTRLNQIDETVEDAKQHLDIYPVLCYPFEWNTKGSNGGIGEETIGSRPQFEEWWETVQKTSERHHSPGEFVTFPAYEWHGDRTRWGDRNVIYFDEGQPLDDAETVEALHENLADRRAFAIPHHTAYQVGRRGQDWDTYDPEFAPVTEVYSTHGSSEGVDTPVQMEQNADMGPRTSGGTFVDALDRGHRVGAIASNDLSGLPGTWGKGVAGIWAEDLSREAIWKAIEARRTYGVTGDRMNLWWSMSGAPMGSVVEGRTDLAASVSIECPRPLRHVELLHNGRVTETYTHYDEWTRPNEPDGRYSILVELGWGPNGSYGDFDRTAVEWRGSVSVDGGALVSVQPRFRGFGQRYEVSGDECRFDLVTDRSDGHIGDKQGFNVELDADGDTDLVIELDDGNRWTVPVAEASKRTHLFVREDWSVETVETEFGLTEDDIENRDVYFHNAPKVKVFPAYPKEACTAEVQFDDLSTTGNDYYYVRASQIDGQYAWSSPIWIEQ